MNPLDAFKASKTLNIKMNRQPATETVQDDKADIEPKAPQQSITQTPYPHSQQAPQDINTQQHQDSEHNAVIDETNCDDKATLPESDLTVKQAQAPITPKQDKSVTSETVVSKKTKPDVAPVDISIAGTHHRIVCPTDEVHHLETAVAYINDKIRSIRQEIKGKIPTNEELLVLTCLEMYDQLQTLKDDEEYYTNERDEALVLIDGMLKTTKVL